MSDDAESKPLRRVLSAIEADPWFDKKYELEQRLGEGASGVVFCARHRELNVRHAIKFLKAGSENAEAVARFRREARAAHRLRGEHVVRTLDVITTQGGVPYVVMEYLEGSDLGRLLRESSRAPVPVRDAVDFILQTCDALAECHSTGIVHRDLKPSNLFCTEVPNHPPIIKVLDFGISKLESIEGDEINTGRNEVMGSPPYMSPEQLTSPLEVDHRTDIWALGVILYELVTGTRPFAGNKAIDVWESMKHVPTPIERLRIDAPRALTPIVLRCLERKRENRFQTVADLATALLPLAPSQARSTVARIVRTVEAAGGNTESPLPPSGRASMGGVSASLLALPNARLRRIRVLAWASVGLVSGAVVAAALRLALVPPSRPLDASTGAPSARAARNQSGTQPGVDTRSGVVDTALPSAEPSSAPLVVGKHGGGESSHASGSLRRGAAGTSSPAASVRLKSTPTASAASSSVPVESRSDGAENSVPKATPWVVDIIEQRKGKPKGTP